MSEHLPESLIGQDLMAWCPTCNRETRHRVDRVAVGAHAGKIGPCLNAHRNQKTKKQLRTEALRESLRRQPSLFGDPV